VASVGGWIGLCSLLRRALAAQSAAAKRTGWRWRLLWLSVLGLVFSVPPLVDSLALGPCASGADFEFVLAHEIGHALGLGHPQVRGRRSAAAATRAAARLRARAKLEALRGAACRRAGRAWLATTYQPVFPSRLPSASLGRSQNAHQPFPLRARTLLRRASAGVLLAQDGAALGHNYRLPLHQPRPAPDECFDDTRLLSSHEHVADSVLDSYARHARGYCLSADDVEGLRWLYPPKCGKALRRGARARTAALRAQTPRASRARASVPRTRTQRARTDGRPLAAVPCLRALALAIRSSSAPAVASHR
jgi:hypothetical protein